MGRQQSQDPLIKGPTTIVLISIGDHEWYFAIDNDAQRGSSIYMMKNREMYYDSRKGVQFLLFY